MLSLHGKYRQSAYGLFRVLFSLVSLVVFCQSASLAATLVVGDFSAPSSGEYPENWQPLTFEKIEKKTSYSLVPDEKGLVILAESNQSASGLITKQEIDVEQWPVIRWRWKIKDVMAGGDVSKKEGDDYPARIYIAFKYEPDKVDFFEKVKFNLVKVFYGEYPPTSSINYIWANKAPKDLIVDNPFTNRVKMIVVESGPTLKGQWMYEERNILEDYKKAFQSDPPILSGVAIMTDSDNTGESATAWYGDITFHKTSLNSTEVTQENAAK